ncbi:membrane-associated progesterone receptor component 1-like [Cimex lectularius]|uniref:Cytochrome b5 heme-binding domain-containing protein n=1 Tax=Cimex lectularius TaxID=79782 RepID=A0A8I6S5X3_CIMLE|nr:membrane-associated progesterone receptor component 1-like [Cimex lectularius]
MANGEGKSGQESGFFVSVLSEIFTSPLNLILVAVITVLVYKIFRGQQQYVVKEQVEPRLPSLKRKDYTLKELKKFDGTGPDGRILVAVNGKVFDVSTAKRFYGPGGTYAEFAGCDASRGLATFSVKGNSEEYDDLSDLGSMEMDSIREWETQFTERYECVGKLLKPGQEPTSYSDDEEEETSQQEPNDLSKED